MENLVSYERNQSFVRPFSCFDVVWAYFPYLPFATLLVGLYTRVLPVNNARSFVDLIFRDYDKDGNGSIDFSEFILAMNASLSSSVSPSHGTHRDKLTRRMPPFNVCVARPATGKEKREPKAQ